jgi:hypothetical protein
LTSLGKATGTVGVEVIVGGGVSEGWTAWVAVEVVTNSVAVALMTGVGVSVTGAFEGRLQADRARTRARAIHELLNFITLLLLSVAIISTARKSNCKDVFGLLLFRDLLIILCRKVEDGNG